MQLGQLASGDEEEERKQRDFKSLLNKLTPEKYQVILQKMVDVGIDTLQTLYGFIDQVTGRTPLYSCNGILCSTA